MRRGCLILEQLSLLSSGRVGGVRVNEGWRKISLRGAQPEGQSPCCDPSAAHPSRKAREGWGTPRLASSGGKAGPPAIGTSMFSCSFRRMMRQWVSTIHTGARRAQLSTDLAGQPASGTDRPFIWRIFRPLAPGSTTTEPIQLPELHTLIYSIQTTKMSKVLEATSEWTDLLVI